MNPMQAYAIVDRTMEKCFLCRLIEEDLRLHGKLTDHPKDYNGSGGFPVDGKMNHLKLEQASLDNRK